MLEILIKAARSAKGMGILRLRMTILSANRRASLRMAWLWLFSLLFLSSSVEAGATIYYVSSSTGNDANSGTSASAAWQTIAHVNGQTFLPGDSVLFKRGDVWNESLVPASSGSSGNPIAFDAYGSGPAPNLTGYYSVPGSAWVFVTGNAWKAPLPANYTSVNFCLFGSIWGQKVPASSSNLTAQWDFYLANGYIYVYSVGSPGTFYNEPIVPMALSNVPVINVNGRSWLTFQHFLINWFDQYGVYVQGASDHLVFANMEADSMIPQGTQPLGFYVNESAPGPGDIKIYDSEAHLNYEGFRFDGSATAITMVNDKGYANRDGALVDNTGAVTYSYCHFYASSLAVAGSTDVEWTSGNGPAAGAGNIAADTAPAVQVYRRYPALVTLTVDDAGMTPGADSYYANTVLPVADAAGVPVGAAITVGYPLAQTLVSEFQSWINAGRDVTSHSMSHTYYTNTDALDIQYTGSGSAATLNISGNTLTITVTGASDSVSYNLAQGQPQGTILGLAQALAATGKYTYSFLTPCQGPYGTGCSAYTAAALLSQDLANVSGQDVKSAVYHMQLNVTSLTTDEIKLSREWMTTNLTGLPATPVFVYPGGYETTAMQGIAAGVPYMGARGGLKEDLGVKDTYADGFNAQNITSFGVNPSWMGLAPGSLNQKIQALLWKESVWGVPWGIFWHLNELTQSDPVGGTEITNLIQDFKASGATIQTNTGLVNWLLGGTQETGTDGNYYYKIPATSMTLDFRPTKNSPVVDAGQNLGSAYALDINGINQNSYGSGWEIGAHVYQGYAVYGENQPGSYFTVGGTTGSGPAAQLPLVWVNNQEWQGTGTYTINFPSSGSGGNWSCGAANYGPYTAGSQSSSQQAINDAESCRTASGAGATIVFPAGAVYSGNPGWVLPQTAGDTSTNFIVLTSSATLPPGQTVCSHGIQDNVSESIQPGIRNVGCNGTALSYQLGNLVTPVSGNFTLANGTATSASAYDDIASMFTVECTQANCNAIHTANYDGNNLGPHHYAIVNAEIRPQAGMASVDAPVKIGLGSEIMASQIPTHIHLAYDYIHGDWTDAPVSGGVATGSPTGANSLPNDIALEGCINCSVAYSYMDRSIRPGEEGHMVVIALGQTLKIVHNWMEGQSSSIFPGGFSGPVTINGFVPAQDVEDRANRYTYPYSWILAYDAGYCPNGLACVGNGYVRKNAHESKVASRYLFDGNILENVDQSGGQNGTVFSFKDDNTSGGPFGTNYWLLSQNITMTNNIGRGTCDGPSIGYRSANSSGNGGGVALGTGHYLYSNNLLYNLNQATPGCAGATAQYGLRVVASVPGTTWAATAVRDSLGLTSTLTLTAGSGSGASDFSVGDPVQVSGCADNSFNTTSTAMGPSALNGTLTSGLTVVYSNPGAANGVTTGCTLSNGQGWPNYVTTSHNTTIADVTSFEAGSYDPYNSANGGSNPYALARNFSDTNNLHINGNFYSTYGEGTRTETTVFDPSTETFNNTLISGRDAAATCPGHTGAGAGGAICYTEYGGPNAGASPPVTVYLKPTAYCTGNDPMVGSGDAACVGILGGMSTSTFPTVVSDWHSYRLCHGGDAACNSKASLYAAGQTYQATDGTDLGVSTPAIDGAETQNLYICGSPCGAPGPYPDTYSAPIGGVAMGTPPLTASTFSTYYSMFSTLLSNPNITAIAPMLPWNAIESNTTAGSYNWTTIDSDLMSLSASGKRLRLIADLSTEGGQNTGTPEYVFGASWAASVGAATPQDMVVCAGFTGDSGSPYGNTGFVNGGVWNSSNSTYGSDLSGQPVSYELPFKTAAKNFITQFVEHFSSACTTFSSDCSNAAALAEKIDYVRFGFTAGGEDHPLCTSYWPLPTGYETFQGAYLDGSASGGHTGYVDEMTTYIAGAVETYHPAWTVVFDTSDPLWGQGHTFADHEAKAGAAFGYGFGTDGFQISDVADCPGINCSGDWYTSFGTYAGVPHYLQTLTASCPDNSCQAGNLVSMLQFSTQHGARAFELYPCDLLLAFAPSSYPGTGAQACSPTFSTALYSASYATAIAEANSGP